MPEFTVNPSDILVKFTAPEDRVVHGPSMVRDGVTDEMSDAERRIRKNDSFVLKFNCR